MIPVENRTPFASELVSVLDRNGREVWVLVIVSTFQWEGTPQLLLVATQEAVCFADEYCGDPAMSSVVRESDVCPPKPLVDVLVDGFAYAPGGRSTESVVVGLAVGDIRKELRVTGDRSRTGATVPFHKMPIVYERALGGVVAAVRDRAGEICRANPIGVGFRGAPPANLSIRTASPNIEHTTSSRLTDRPAGFGIVGRGWTPRLELAGTYDGEWLERQWPLAPKDFDDRHHQCAPQDQQSPTIQGGELVRLINLTPDGLWEFRLPRLEVPVYMIRDRGPAILPTRLDTVYIRPETRRVVMCHRAALQKTEGEPDPRELVLGHMTGAWLNARCTKRYYLDLGETCGERIDAPLFS